MCDGRINRHRGIKNRSLVEGHVDLILQVGCPFDIVHVAGGNAGGWSTTPGNAAVGGSRDGFVIDLVEGKIVIDARRIESVIERKTAVSGFTVRGRPVADRPV